MDNAPIRSPQKPSPASAPAQPGARQAPGNAAPGGFSLLLADMAQPAAVEDESLAAQALELTPGDVAEAGIFSLASLVGQTARMDAAADTALRDGRDLAADERPRGSAGHPLTGAARHLPPASPASASAWNPVRASGAQDMAQAAAIDVNGATGAAGAEGGSDTGRAPSTVSLTPSAHSAERTTERITERTVAPPGLAALLAQMDAVPASDAPGLGLGSGPAAAGAGAAGAAGAAAPVPGAGQGLVDTAASVPAEVSDAAAADGLLAQPDEALVGQLSEQVAFWVQQKTQRATMTLDRQGQPVQVQVALTGSEAHVTFRSNEQQTRDMLDASMAQLRELLEQQGLSLAGVTVQSGDAGRQPAGAGQGRGGDHTARGQDADGRQTATVSVPAPAGLHARPDASRTVDLFV